MRDDLCSALVMKSRPKHFGMSRPGSLAFASLQVAAMTLGCSSVHHQAAQRSADQHVLQKGRGASRSDGPRQRPTDGAIAQNASPASVSKPSSSQSVGIQSPIWVKAASPTGEWLVVCQAREDSNGDGRLAVSRNAAGQLEGDRSRPYLLRRSGRDEPLEAWLGSSPDGRWLALRQQGHSSIVDTLSERVINLESTDFDGRNDGLSHAHHRAVAFSPDSARIALILRSKAIRVVDLDSGKQRDYSVAPSRPWRVEFSTDAASLRVWLVTEDKNGNGRLDWPVPAEPSSAECLDDGQRFSTWLDYGDPVALRVIHFGRRRPLKHRHALGSLGEGIVARQNDGSLWLVEGTRKTLLTDKDCGGTLLHVDPRRALALVVCSAVGVRAPVLLVGPGLRLELPIEVLASTVDYVGESTPRLIPLYPGADAVLVDLELRKLHPLEAGDAVLTVRDSLALIRRDTRLLLLDVDRDSTIQLAEDLPDFSQILVTLPIVYVEPYLVDLSSRAVVGTSWGPIAALAQDGGRWVAHAPESQKSLAQGPLFWIPRDAPGNSAMQQ